MKNDFKSRLALFSVFFAVMLIGVVLRIVLVQASSEADLFRRMGEKSAWVEKVLKPERGKIYDRNGNMLAGNKITYEIGLTLTNMKDPQAVAMGLSNVLGTPYDEMYALITGQAPEQVYLTISQFASKDQGEQLILMQKDYTETGQGLNLAGLEFSSRLSRSYPNGKLASSVMGFVLRNNSGNYGVEQKYDSQLAGIPITVLIPQDPTMAGNYPNPPKGTDLILTIDRNIQSLVEKTLEEKVLETGSKSGTIVVMDPKTGEILAMANTPQIDLNKTDNFLEVFPLASDFNRSVSAQYEPGSIFKLITMSAALDSGIVTPNTTYLDTGFYQIDGVNIFNWDRGAWGVQDMTGCMQNSLNVCMAQLAVTMGPDVFYSYIQKFGIGNETGIDIAGEAKGFVKDPKVPEDNWIPLELGTNSFGQGIAVSPIQMLTAASAIANDGKMVAPHVVKAMVSNGIQTDTTIQTLGTPIRPETSRTLSEMLAQAFDNNHSVARVDGYRIAGKTGTASIPGPDGQYDPNLTNQSFIGWGPIDDPKFMVFLWFEQPQSEEWASMVVSPIFSDMVKQLVVLMDIPPDDIRLKLLSSSGQ